MYRVTKELHFCYGHRLLNYEGKCRLLHGHNARALIELQSAELDHRGMVADFNDIKATLQSWIDENLDHRMLLHRDDPVIPYLKKMGEPYFIMAVNPTAESIAKLIYDYALSRGLAVVQVTLWETDRSYATYCGDSGR
jgi:6-pyruvoyltetrahydropterin/6-carboxytetrahydropterin synthase